MAAALPPRQSSTHAKGDVYFKPPTGTSLLRRWQTVPEVRRARSAAAPSLYLRAPCRRARRALAPPPTTTTRPALRAERIRTSRRPHHALQDAAGPRRPPRPHVPIGECAADCTSRRPRNSLCRQVTVRHAARRTAARVRCACVWDAGGADQGRSRRQEAGGSRRDKKARDERRIGGTGESRPPGRRDAPRCHYVWWLSSPHGREAASARAQRERWRKALALAAICARASPTARVQPRDPSIRPIRDRWKPRPRRWPSAAAAAARQAPRTTFDGRAGSTSRTTLVAVDEPRGVRNAMLHPRARVRAALRRRRGRTTAALARAAAVDAACVDAAAAASAPAAPAAPLRAAVAHYDLCGDALEARAPPQPPRPIRCDWTTAASAARPRARTWAKAAQDGTHRGRSASCRPADDGYVRHASEPRRGAGARAGTRRAAVAPSRRLRARPGRRSRDAAPKLVTHVQ